MKERMKERIGTLALLLLLQMSRCRHISAISEVVSAMSFISLPKNAQHLQCGRASAREAYASMCWLRMCELQTHELCIHGAAVEEQLSGLLLVKYMKPSDWSCCSVFRSLSYSERPSWCFCRLCDLSSQTHISMLAKGDLSTVV